MVGAMEKTLDIGGDLVSTDERSEIRAGFVGCGSHAFRNIYPTLQFAPVDLAATCDVDAESADAYADQFGAERSYDDYHEMLDAESLDAVFAVLNYDENGRPKYPQIATDAMRAGCHAWIEKPPAASTDEIRDLKRVEAETDQFVHVGFKKVYNPAVEKAKEITERSDFGPINTIYVRYPESLPDRAHPGEQLTHDSSLVGLLDHLTHPGSIMSYLGGAMESVHVSASDGGGGFVTIQFESGALGTIHLTAGDSGSSPLERVEVVGDGANVVVKNGIELEYYRPYDKGPYGRTTDFMDGTGEAPIRWRPEFSLGQLYNKNLFTLGYYHEIADFAESCLDGTPPEKAGTEMALELLTLYEAVLRGEDRHIEL
jgi:predicted dehydrogenase